MENRPFYELCDIVRETSCAKGGGIILFFGFQQFVLLHYLLLLCLLFLSIIHNYTYNLLCVGEV